MTTIKISQEEVNAELDRLTDQTVLCRNLDHQWDEVPASHMDPPEPGFYWECVRCIRCTTTRTSLIVADTGDRAKGLRYKWPEGYKSSVKLTKSEMRREWALRQQYITETKAPRRTKKKPQRGSTTRRK